MVWQHEEEKQQKILKILNSCHPTTKFTVEYSLDVEVIRCGNKLLSDLNIKPRSTQKYLKVFIFSSLPF